MAFSPDGRLLAAQGGSPEWNLVLWVWEKSKVVTSVKTTNAAGNPVYQVRTGVTGTLPEWCLYYALHLLLLASCLQQPLDLLLFSLMLAIQTSPAGFSHMRTIPTLPAAFQPRALHMSLRRRLEQVQMCPLTCHSFLKPASVTAGQ